VTPALSRPTWFEIDLDAIAENVRTVRRLIGADRELIAAMKGDGYGFGSVEVAEVFVANGVNRLAVADLADAIRLRKHGIAHPILLYPNALPEAAAQAVAFGITPTVTDEASARAYSTAAATTPLGVFVKVDVGLERLGVPADEAVQFVRGLLRLPRLAVEGIYTHLHVPAGVDRAYIDWQVERFTRVLDALDIDGVRIPVRLAASSPAVLRFPGSWLNAVDPGRILYGAVPGNEPSPVPLGSAFRALKTRLIAVRPTVPRERFAAEAPFALDIVRRLGVIPAGWGDGLATLSAGRVLVRGVSVPILARPSFEHTRVDLTSVADACVGDEVVLIGRQGTAEITLDEVAARNGVESIQLAPAVRESVARVYLSGGEATKVRTRE
jgi:alanine racemase